MNLTPKKLKVSANINMAYVINYLSRYCNYSAQNAFLAFISTAAYRELMDFSTGFASAMGTDILFFAADDLGIDLAETDEKIEGAFDISEKLQYCVNICEGFREHTKISTKAYYKYIKTNNIWHYVEENYSSLAPLQKSEVFEKMKGLTKQDF